MYMYYISFTLTVNFQLWKFFFDFFQLTIEVSEEGHECVDDDFISSAPRGSITGLLRVFATHDCRTQRMLKELEQLSGKNGCLITNLKRREGGGEREREKEREYSVECRLHINTLCKVPNSRKFSLDKNLHNPSTLALQKYSVFAYIGGLPP